MLKDSYPFYLAKRPEAPNQDLEATDKHTGEAATRVVVASAADINRAIAGRTERRLLVIRTP